jgi:hypothetical protein
MNIGVIIIIVSFLIGAILIAIALGLFFGVKTTPEYVGGGTGGTGTSRPDRYTYCLYNGKDTLGAFKPFTYIVRDNDNFSGTTGTVSCPPNTDNYTLLDSIRVYKTAKTNDMIKICVYDTLQKDIVGNYVIGRYSQIPGEQDICPQIGRNSESFPGEQAMRNIASFYTRGVFGADATIPNDIDLGGATYKKFCVWKSSDQEIEYYNAKPPKKTFRSKNKWVRADGPTGPCVSPGEGYTKVGEFLFEDPTTPSPLP